MKIAPVADQPLLFWMPPVIHCDSGASARNAFGTAAEEITRELLELERIPINGSYDVCFDAKKGEKYFEIKSTSKKGGKVVLYDWRLEKDEASGVDLTYIIVCHGIEGQREDIVQAMLSRPLELLLLPGEIIRAMALEMPKQTIKSELVEGWSERSGYARSGYKDGYRNLPLKTIWKRLSWTTTTLPNPCGDREITIHTYEGTKDNHEN